MQKMCGTKNIDPNPDYDRGTSIVTLPISSGNGKANPIDSQIDADQTSSLRRSYLVLILFLFTLTLQAQSPGGVSSGLNIWLIASAGTNTTVDGEALTSWADQSGSGHDASDNGGSGTVTYESGVTDLVNFHPVIKMVSADKTMSFTQFSSRDLIIVCRVDGSTPDFGGIIGHTSVGPMTNRISGMNAVWRSGSDQWANAGIEVNGHSDNNHNREVHVTFQNSNVLRPITSVGGYYHVNSSRSFTGEIMEVIGYSSNLSSNSVDRIQSYLALKYGITLDQSSGIDYLASNGISVWDASENTTYKHDIAGIGKDTSGELDQPKSKSQNSDAILTIESASNISDAHWLIWANNDGVTTTAGSVMISSTTYERMGRVWHIQEKNHTENGSTGVGTADELGNVDLSFDLTGITHVQSNVRLLVGSDENFTLGTYTSHAGTFDGDQVTFSGVDVDDGEFISLTTDVAKFLSFSVVEATQPSNTQLNAVITPLVKVAIVDSDDNVLTGRTDEITLAIDNDPSGGSASLTGATVSAVSGIAEFTNLMIDEVGTGYTLLATSDLLASATSGSFDITPGPIDVSETGTEITGVNLIRTADGLEQATITVQLKDVQGNNISTSGVDVSFATTLGDLSSSTTVTNSSGQASVTLASTVVGTATVTSTVDHDDDGGTAQLDIDGSVMVTFDSGPASKISFKVQPATTRAGEVMNPSVEVEVLDANDNLVTSASGSISVTLTSGNSLSGTTSETIQSGIATFDNLTTDVVSTAQILEASFSSFMVQSTLFNVTGSPGGMGVGLIYWLDAQDLDADGNSGEESESGLTGTEVNTWGNKGTGIDFTNDAGTSPGTLPDFKQNEINFNSAVEFNGAVITDYLGAKEADFPTTNITQFLVLKTTQTARGGIFSYAVDDNGAHNNHHNEFLLFGSQNMEMWIEHKMEGSTIDFNSGVPELVSVDWESLGGNLNLYKNGKNEHSKVISKGKSMLENGTIILAQDQDNVGGGFQTGQIYQGLMSEVITYSGLLNQAERQRVESYLAIKYGITLDQSSAQSYLASNGVAIWDHTASPANTFNHDITGIGKDLGSALEQTKSKSSNNDGIVTINANGAIADGQFMVWSNNNSSTTTTTSVTINEVNHSRMSRAWYVQEKSLVDAGGGIGTVSDLGSVDVTFDLSGISYTADEVRLLIGNDENFGAGSIVSPVIGTFDGDVVTFTGVADLTDGKFFSLAVSFTPKLVFSSQPGNTPLNAVINGSNGINVSVLDGADQLVSSSSISILLGFDTNPGSGTLSGTLIKSAVMGVASFDDISINNLGSGYTLKANSGDAREGVSSSFDITGAPGGNGVNLHYWSDANDLDGDGLIEEESESTQTGGRVDSWISRYGGLTFNNISHVEPDKIMVNFSGSNFNTTIDFQPEIKNVPVWLQATFTDFPNTEVTQFFIYRKLEEDGFLMGVFGAPRLTLLTIGQNLVLNVNDTEETTTEFETSAGNPRQILSLDRTSGNGETNVYHNGELSINSPYILHPGVQQNSSGAFDFLGLKIFEGNSRSQVSEMITYRGVLSTEERQRIQSYLALKHGVSLDQTTPSSYKDSDGNVVWNAAEDATYVHDIAGIGRDDNSSLNQKQSVTANNDAIVTLGLGNGVSVLPISNAANSNSFSTDKSFLIWGNDNAELDAPKGSPAHDQIPTEVGVNSRLNRQWRVQETGTVGEVNIQFDLSHLPSLDAEGNPTVGTNDEAQLVLLVSKTPDFTDAAAQLEKVILSFETPGDNLATFRYDFDDGDYFTLGSSELEALPIKLLSFSGKSDEDHVLLKWATGSEENNAHFRIERTGPDLDFQVVGFSNGGGTRDAVQYYSFKDMEPLKGINYYRLIDVDENGNENASEVIRVVHQTGNDSQVEVQVYPNPSSTNGEVIIKFPLGELASDYHITISDLQGQVFEFAEQTVIEDRTLQVSTRGLGAGIYLLHFRSVYGKYSHKKLVIKN